MSEFFLLNDKNSCPHCRARREFITGNCRNCGTKVFTNANQDFTKFEQETGCRYWWAWDDKRGFVSRDHWMVSGAIPLIRHYVPPAIDKNYGKQPMAEAGKQVRMKRTL